MEPQDQRNYRPPHSIEDSMAQHAAPVKTVVVAVGDTHTRERFSAALQQAGHHAIEVRTQSDLLARVRLPSGVADLVVLDLRLAESGVGTVRTLKSREPRISIVVLSGSVRDAGEVRALAKLGIDSRCGRNRISWLVSATVRCRRPRGAGSTTRNEHCADRHILPSLAPRLFPDSFNRRTSIRVTLDLPVAFRFADTIATAPTLNLSKGGLGVRTMTPLEMGTKVHVRFRLPGSQRDVGADSRVAWSDHRAGMGLQFEEVGTPDQSAIDEYVDRQSFGNRTVSP